MRSIADDVSLFIVHTAIWERFFEMFEKKGNSDFPLLPVPVLILGKWDKLHGMTKRKNRRSAKGEKWLIQYSLQSDLIYKLSDTNTDPAFEQLVRGNRNKSKLKQCKPAGSGTKFWKHFNGRIPNSSLFPPQGAKHIQIKGFRTDGKALLNSDSIFSFVSKDSM